MRTSSFRLVLVSVFTTLITLFVVAALLLTARGGLAQEVAPDGPVGTGDEPRAASADSAEGLQVVEVPIIPSNDTGDGFPSGGPAAQEGLPTFGPDSPDSPNIFFSYFRLLGTAFNPRTTTTTFGYNLDGCIYETGGTDNRFMAPLLVPDRSILKFLRIYYKDTNAADNITAWLTRYTPGVSSTDLTTVDSAGSAGYGTTLSNEITHTVDLTNYAYAIIFAPNGNSPTLSFCGVRVAYYTPLFPTAALPFVKK